MGTTSKGQGVWISPRKKERYCDNGAFGQSHQQKVQNHNNRVTAAKAEQEKSKTTKPKV